MVITVSLGYIESKHKPVDVKLQELSPGGILMFQQVRVSHQHVTDMRQVKPYALFYTRAKRLRRLARVDNVFTVGCLG